MEGYTMDWAASRFCLRVLMIVTVLMAGGILPARQDLFLVGAAPTHQWRPPTWLVIEEPPVQPWRVNKCKSMHQSPKPKRLVDESFITAATGNPVQAVMKISSTRPVQAVMKISSTWQHSNIMIIFLCIRISIIKILLFQSHAIVDQVWAGIECALQTMVQFYPSAPPAPAGIVVISSARPSTRATLPLCFKR